MLGFLSEKLCIFGRSDGMFVEDDMAVNTDGSMTDLEELTDMTALSSVSLNISHQPSVSCSTQDLCWSWDYKWKTNKTLERIRSKAGFITENNSYNSTSISSTVTLVTCICRKKKTICALVHNPIRARLSLSRRRCIPFPLSNAARKKRNKAIIALIPLVCPRWSSSWRRHEEYPRQVVGRRRRKCSTECVWQDWWEEVFFVPFS